MKRIADVTIAGKILRCRLLALLLLAGCSPEEIRQQRLATETNDLEIGLDEICIGRFADGLAPREIASALNLKSEIIQGFPEGVYRVYQLPGRKMSMAIEANRCAFTVGLPGATGDDLVELERVLERRLAVDRRKWGAVRPDNIGHGWCDASNQMHLHSLEADAKHPGGLGALIRNTGLQVSVERDQSGWMCHYLSGPTPVYRNPYKRAPLGHSQ